MAISQFVMIIVTFIILVILSIAIAYLSITVNEMYQNYNRGINLCFF